MKSRKTKGGEYDFGGPRWFVFNTYWRFDAAFSTKTVEPGNWGASAFAPRYFAAHVEFCKTFRLLSRYLSMTTYERSKSNRNIVVMTKTICYFRLDRVWNIHVQTTENSISRFLDFNIFWGSNLPQETPRGSRLWRSQYFPLLRNIRISTNTPSQTPATRLMVYEPLYHALQIR